ncbi:endonuclease [Candidatus Uhrbacteria bacterium CG10_big_fil_rev_8_21_14_0_10_48_16]|uniref:Endonuclease n=1 Tax=Candidatus Uhrbacteria bacterium CG10_big_fil_rev_8_21_14_0_10_48_16 TaxID=1975038 RepID=A0A2M8LHW2_9BACT|nr:MAG: endonuclease [Candidatus Uhrbacteria bacterium CG10_big_fil_rev_8_21_14_0_10_48_16]
MYHVYVIESELVGRWYIGCTQDVSLRLNYHNAGKVRSTKPYIPYRLVHTETFSTLREARQREILIKKSGRIRKELKDKYSAPSSIG